MSPQARHHATERAAMDANNPLPDFDDAAFDVRRVRRKKAFDLVAIDQSSSIEADDPARAN